MSRFRILLAASAVALGLPTIVDAQIRASEPATVSQTIDGTTITIEYYRPRVRGRSPLFGHDAVVWENPWTPGANWATTIEFERPIEIEGVPLEAGKYSLWMDMSEDEFMPEEFIIEPEPLYFHTMPPRPSPEQVRLPVVMEEAPFTETLTWGFENYSSTGGTLALRWGDARIAFDVKVEPSMRMTVTEEEAAPVLGDWEMWFAGPGGQDGPPFTVTFTRDDAGILHADFEGVLLMDGSGEEDAFFNDLDMWLLPLADRVFMPAEAYDGILTEAWDGFYMEFDGEGGPSMNLQLREENDLLGGGGKRVN